jgi:hypothetical protein
VSHDDHRRFDAEDLRLMTNLGTFAAAAYQTLLSLNASRQIASIVESSDDAIISKDLDGSHPILGIAEQRRSSAIPPKRSSASR